MGAATRLHQPPHLPCRRCLRLRSLLRQLPSVLLRLCADRILSGALLSRAGLRLLASCAGPKLHPATPGSSKQLLSLLRPAETRKRESFAALGAKNEESIIQSARRVLQIHGTAAAANAHEEPRNIAAAQTLACGAERSASEGAAASSSPRDAKKQK